jgi:C1A family cysteine protease
MRSKSKLNRKYGCIPDIRDQRDFTVEDHMGLVASISLPKSDTHLKPFLPSVRNQLDVGMCTGCGSTSALKLLLNSQDYKWPFTPSALDVYAKVRVAEGNSLTDDSGAAIADVMAVLNEQGVCPEDSNAEWSWPFSASDNRWQQQPPAACEKDALMHKLIKFMRVQPTVQGIKSALVQGMPIVIGISVYDSFEAYGPARTGMIPMPMPYESLLGGHCMFLWGYGEVDPTHADGQNSWGDDWGDQGRFHIPFSYLTDRNLTSDLWAIQLLT